MADEHDNRDFASLRAALSRDLQPAARFGYALAGISASARDTAIELTFQAAGGPFVIWLRAADAPGGAFRTTSRFKIGYLEPPPDDRGWQLLDEVCRWLETGAENLGTVADLGTVTRFFSMHAGESPRGDCPQVLVPAPVASPDPHAGVTSLPPELLGLPCQVGVKAARVKLAITARCNERCPFCCSPPHPSIALPDDDAIVRAIEAAARTGFSGVEFSGGEPTLHRGLPGFVQQARRLGLYVQLQSNLRVPAGYWRRFVDADGRPCLPDLLVGSFHTTRATRTKLLTGVAGGLATKVRAVREAREAGVEINLNFVISRLNADEVAGFPDYVHRTFGPGITLSFSFVSPDGRVLDDLSLIPRVRDVAPALDTALTRATALGLTAWVIEYCGLPPCVLPGQASSFETPGVPRHEPADRPRWTKLPGCRECVHDPACRGFWKVYVDRYGGDEFVPIRRGT